MKCLLSLLMLLPVGSMAQDDGEQQQSSQFTADLQLLTRGEIRNGGMTYDPENPPKCWLASARRDFKP